MVTQSRSHSRSEATVGCRCDSWWSATFGLLPLLIPVPLGRFFGLKTTDIFLYRQAGAATLRYAVMGVFGIKSRHWLELRWPVVMAAVFNGLSFLASLLALASGETIFLVYLVGAASLGVTIATLIALRRGGI